MSSYDFVVSNSFKETLRRVAFELDAHIADAKRMSSGTQVIRLCGQQPWEAILWGLPLTFDTIRMVR